MARLFVVTGLLLISAVFLPSAHASILCNDPADIPRVCIQALDTILPVTQSLPDQAPEFYAGFIYVGEPEAGVTIPWVWSAGAGACAAWPFWDVGCRQNDLIEPVGLVGANGPATTLFTIDRAFIGIDVNGDGFYDYQNSDGVILTID